MRYVLDAWALLAFLQREEPAASRVKQLLQDAQDRQADLSMSIMNLGEVYYRIGRARGRDEAVDALRGIRRLAIDVLPATDDMVMAAADLKMTFAISYADAFAAAAAAQTGATLVTGDPELSALQSGIQIEQLHRNQRRSTAAPGGAVPSP